MATETTTKTDKQEDFRQRLRIKIRAYDHKIIDQSAKTILDTAKRVGANIVGPIPLPTEKSRFTVTRSSFVHKDARDQFEMRVHKRLIDILDPDQKIIDSLMGLNLPAGVDVEIKMQYCRRPEVSSLIALRPWPPVR